MCYLAGVSFARTGYAGISEGENPYYVPPPILRVDIDRLAEFGG